MHAVRGILVKKTGDFPGFTLVQYETKLSSI